MRRRTSSFLTIIHFYKFHILGKLLCALFFMLLELSECEVSSIVGGCILTTYGLANGDSDYGNLFCNDSTIFSTAPSTTIVLPQLPIVTTSSLIPPVEIHSPQMKFTAQSGDSVFMPCSVLNLGTNQLLWRHGNNILIGNHYVPSFDKRRIRLFEDFTLQLSQITPEDEGAYECLITTTWPLLNVVHTLTVADPPSLNIFPDTGSVIVNEDENVTIGCIPKGNPMPKISWYKRDGKIPLDFQQLNNNEITLTHVTRKDTGLYICRADNKVGRPAIGSVYVRVQHIPEVSAPTRRVYGGVKHRAELTCVVNSDPKAEVHWLFKQLPIPYSPRIFEQIVGKEHRLIFSEVKSNDFGMYMCVATNFLGYDARHIELTGVPKPPVVTKWEISPCIPPNSNGRERIDYESKMSRDHESLKQFLSAPRKSLLSTTLTSPDCSIQMTLFWVVESYNELIDYQLIFRVIPMSDYATLLSSSRDEEHRLSHLAWREVVIPADDDSLSYIHSKSFTTFGLKNNSIFEGGLKARNKWGSSFLSEIIHLKIVAKHGRGPARNTTDYFLANGTDAVIILETNAGHQRLGVQPIGAFILNFFTMLILTLESRRVSYNVL